MVAEVKCFSKSVSTNSFAARASSIGAKGFDVCVASFTTTD